MIAITGIVLVGSSLGLITWYVLNRKIKQEKPTAKLISFKPFKNYPFIYSVSGFFIGWILLNNILAGCIFAVISFFIPGMIKKWETKRYIDKFNNQLVDAIIIISSSLKAGVSLIQGIDAAAKRLPDPISSQFNTVLKENRLGISLEESLIELNRRIKSDDLELVITATLVSYETGGNLTEVYEKIASTIRTRNLMQLKLKTLTSQGKLQGIIVGLLPAVLIVVLSKIAPDMIYPLFHTFEGLMMLAGAVILEGIGIFFIKRITTIDI